MTIRVDQTNSTQQTQTTQSTGPVQHSSVRESLAKRVIGITEKLMYRGQKAVRNVKRNGDNEFLSNVSGLINCAKNNKVKEAGSDSFDLCVGQLKAQLNVKIDNAIIGPGPLGKSESSFLEKYGSLDGLIDLKHDCDKAAKQLLKAYKETGDQRLLMLYGSVEAIGNSTKEAIEKFNQVKLQNTWFFSKGTDKKAKDAYANDLQANLGKILKLIEGAKKEVSSDVKKCSPEAQVIILGKALELAEKNKEMKKTACYLACEIQKGPYDSVMKGLKAIGIDLTPLLSEYENNVHGVNAGTAIRYDLLDEASVKKLKSSGTCYLHTIYDENEQRIKKRNVLVGYRISDQPGEDDRAKVPLTEIDKERILAEKERLVYVQDFEKKLESLTAGKLTSEQLEALQKLEKECTTYAERFNEGKRSYEKAEGRDYIDYGAYGNFVSSFMRNFGVRPKITVVELVKNLNNLNAPGDKEKWERLSYKALRDLGSNVFENYRDANLFRAFMEVEPSNVDSADHEAWHKVSVSFASDGILTYLKGKFEAKGEDLEMFMKLKPSDVGSEDYKAWATALKDFDPQKYPDYLEAKRA